MELGRRWCDLAPAIKARIEYGQHKVLAGRLGVEPGVLSNYLSGNREPRIGAIEIMADFCGVGLDELLARRIPPPPVADWLQVRGPKGRPLDVVAVPKVPFRVAAGFAAFPQPDDGDGPELYAFRPAFIRHVLGGLPKNPDSTWGKLSCVQLRKDADSMYPTIRPGAVALVRMGIVDDVSEIKPRRLYLVDEPGGGDEHGIVVKRVSFSKTAGTGALVLESDNRTLDLKYAPRVIDLTDRPVQSVVRGKIVWWSVSAEE